MRTRVVRFIGRLQQAGTLDDLRRAIVGLRDDFGVEHLVYHSLNSTGRQYAALTYPPEWVAHYLAQDYGHIDPVVQGCFRRFHPVDWKRLDWSGRQARSFLGEAVAAGVGNQGYAVPIRGPNGQFAIFTVSDRSGDAAWARFIAENTGDVILIAHFINQKALEIERGTDFHAARHLSRREVDVLTRLASGLNRSQAAESLAISEHTLRAYVETARSKLRAANTTQAVARAIAAGIVLL